MKNKKTKIHLYISGGCGNQFFQYAFARKIQEMYDAELIINYILIRRYQQKRIGNDDLLHSFNVVNYSYKNNIDFGYLIFELLRFVRGIFRLKDFDKRTYKFYLWCAKLLPFWGIYYFDAAYFQYKFRPRRHIYIRGYFESGEYFKEIDNKLRAELVMKDKMSEENEELYKKIHSCNSVCVTIKRQDIEDSRTSDLYSYDISYFYKGIEYIKSKVINPVFFIFSDSIEWCKKNLIIQDEVYYENDGNTIGEKIRLMSACRHFIIHNSTFSWWAQHLSDNMEKIVVAPAKWMQRDDQPIDIYEDNWVYIDENCEITNAHQ
ncbi:MAG: alpha-1,2-fucosyltransferase [Butyrivibrio sp.]|nr:alpha-1,2-fucosyltransferase [Butyrivibrio sp.]